MLVSYIKFRNFTWGAGPSKRKKITKTVKNNDIDHRKFETLKFAVIPDRPSHM